MLPGTQTVPDDRALVPPIPDVCSSTTQRNPASEAVNAAVSPATPLPRMIRSVFAGKAFPGLETNTRTSLIFFVIMKSIFIMSNYMRIFFVLPGENLLKTLAVSKRHRRRKTANSNSEDRRSETDGAKCARNPRLWFR
jgi:hypothetical protein